MAPVETESYRPVPSFDDHAVAIDHNDTFDFSTAQLKSLEIKQKAPAPVKIYEGDLLEGSLQELAELLHRNGGSVAVQHHVVDGHENFEIFFAREIFSFCDPTQLAHSLNALVNDLGASCSPSNSIKVSLRADIKNLPIDSDHKQLLQRQLPRVNLGASNLVAVLPCDCSSMLMSVCMSRIPLVLQLPSPKSRDPETSVSLLLKSIVFSAEQHELVISKITQLLTEARFPIDHKVGIKKPSQAEELVQASDAPSKVSATREGRSLNSFPKGRVHKPAHMERDINSTTTQAPVALPQKDNETKREESYYLNLMRQLKESGQLL